MKRISKPIAGAAIAAIAVGGTAVAATGGPSAIFGDDKPQEEFAANLADELGGDVSAGEVERALDAVAEERAAEHRRAMAETVVEHLDGVTVDEVVAALEVVDAQMREAFEQGEPPDPGSMVETLAEELGVSEEDVEAALGAAREQAFEEHGDVLEKRFDGDPPPIGPGGPAFEIGGPGFGPGIVGPAPPGLPHVIERGTREEG